MGSIDGYKASGKLQSVAEGDGKHRDPGGLFLAQDRKLAAVDLAALAGVQQVGVVAKD